MNTISPWHRAVSGDLTSCFDFVSPNDPTVPQLPDMSGWLASDNAQKKLPGSAAPAVPQPLFQEPGVRFSRALPYELQVHSSVVPDTKTLGATKVSLTFTNSGAKGAVFHVYDKLNLAKIPRRYTVEPNMQLDDVWQPAATGAYDLWVLGPNGFHRHFTGNAKKVAAAAQPNPDVSVAYDVAGKQIVITLTNNGSMPAAFTLTPNAYVTTAPLNVNVMARSQTKINWSIETTGGWYDLSATVKNSPEYVRRLAGRMETGAPSVSDPATQL
jgi:phospholipase C